MFNSSSSRGKRFTDQQIVKLKDGEILFREGDLSREMYIVQKGALEVFKTAEGNKVILATIERGSMAGEMSLLESLPRSASARAVGDTTLLVFDPGSFLLKIRRDPTFAFELMKHLSGRIRQTNEKLMVLVTAEQLNKTDVQDLVESSL
ncbi:Crp/Fnr family transcriptional regulator [Bdellovibrio svalbardensis]|uniref:Cyclic nucleotide-binding domain-containing protein n=1 Tax=Bdellovibrio svalbardensis TaxID=2972972 RepID=A0ABT6DRB6_9BACT|nr:cyclic nucleotide-binding domain-containing protein [Bdellovibrio svalbardensis]MDG0817698.1 cyclic nucleotide-binding domain-containing protein [Bdellovibrio svalbardensis]